LLLIDYVQNHSADSDLFIHEPVFSAKREHKTPSFSQSQATGDIIPLFKLHAEQLCLSAGSEVLRRASWLLVTNDFFSSTTRSISCKLFALNVNTCTVQTLSE